MSKTPDNTENRPAEPVLGSEAYLHGVGSGSFLEEYYGASRTERISRGTRNSVGSNEQGTYHAELDGGDALVDPNKETVDDDDETAINVMEAQRGAVIDKRNRDFRADFDKE